VRGVSLPSPIDLTRRPYNTGHTTVWLCVITWHARPPVHYRRKCSRRNFQVIHIVDPTPILWENILHANFCFLRKFTYLNYQVLKEQVQVQVFQSQLASTSSALSLVYNQIKIINQKTTNGVIYFVVSIWKQVKEVKEACVCFWNPTKNYLGSTYLVASTCK